MKTLRIDLVSRRERTAVRIPERACQEAVDGVLLGRRAAEPPLDGLGDELGQALAFVRRRHSRLAHENVVHRDRDVLHTSLRVTRT
jgi:hypothetical protein